MQETVRLTTAEALVRFLIAQRIIIDGKNEPLFPGVIAIFGHGNVTSLATKYRFGVVKMSRAWAWQRPHLEKRRVANKSWFAPHPLALVLQTW